MPNYANGKIYKIYDINEPEQFYIGSTCVSLCRRLSSHRYDSKNKPMKLYQYVNGLENGWKNMKIELIIECHCENVEQLLRAEGAKIIELKAPLNRNVAGRSNKEYQQDKNEQITEYQKQYYHKNKDHILEQAKNYQQINSEKIVERGKKYRQINKEKIAESKKQYQQINNVQVTEYQKNYRQKNKDRLAEYDKERRKNNKEKINERRRELRAKKKAEQII